jgi:GWxTD domain-containing protein
MRAEHVFTPSGMQIKVSWQWSGEDLRFIPASNNRCQAKIKLHFTVRGAKKRIFYEWQTVQTFERSGGSCLPQKSEHYYLQRNVALTEGDYLLTCLVEDVQAQTHCYKEQAFGFTPTDYGLSDIHLFYDLKYARPLVGNVVAEDATLLPFRIEILPRPNDYYTLRTALYHQESQTRDQPATHYVLTQQQSVGLKGGQAVYQDFFNIEGLASGKYLLEVYLFTDERLVAYRSREWILPWSGLKAVTANLPEAIRQMEVIAPKAVIQQLLRIQDPNEQLEAFRQFWLGKNLSPDDHPTAAMEAYYQSLTATDTFKTPTLPGWKTDRGQAFLRYGKPDKMLQKEINGWAYQYWHYARYGMTLAFRREQEEWKEM